VKSRAGASGMHGDRIHPSPQRKQGKCGLLPDSDAPPGRQSFRRSELPTCHPGRCGTHNKSDILLVSSSFADPGSLHPSPQCKQGKADDSTAALTEDCFAGCEAQHQQTAFAKQKWQDAMFCVKPGCRSVVSIE